MNSWVAVRIVEETQQDLEFRMFFLISCLRVEQKVHEMGLYSLRQPLICNEYIRLVATVGFFSCQRGESHTKPSQFRAKVKLFVFFEEDLPILGKDEKGISIFSTSQTFGQGDDEWEGLDSEE